MAIWLKELLNWPAYTCMYQFECVFGIVWSLWKKAPVQMASRMKIESTTFLLHRMKKKQTKQTSLSISMQCYMLFFSVYIVHCTRCMLLLVSAFVFNQCFSMKTQIVLVDESNVCICAPLALTHSRSIFLQTVNQTLYSSERSSQFCEKIKKEIMKKRQQQHQQQHSRKRSKSRVVAHNQPLNMYANYAPKCAQAVARSVGRSLRLL